MNAQIHLILSCIGALVLAPLAASMVVGHVVIRIFGNESQVGARIFVGAVLLIVSVELALIAFFSSTGMGAFDRSLLSAKASAQKRGTLPTGVRRQQSATGRVEETRSSRVSFRESADAARTAGHEALARSGGNWARPATTITGSLTGGGEDPLAASRADRATIERMVDAGIDRSRSAQSVARINWVDLTAITASRMNWTEIAYLTKQSAAIMRTVAVGMSGSGGIDLSGLTAALDRVEAQTRALRDLDAEKLRNGIARIQDAVGADADEEGTLSGTLDAIEAYAALAGSAADPVAATVLAEQAAFVKRCARDLRDEMEALRAEAGTARHGGSDAGIADHLQRLEANLGRMHAAVDRTRMTRLDTKEVVGVIIGAMVNAANEAAKAVGLRIDPIRPLVDYQLTDSVLVRNKIKEIREILDIVERARASDDVIVRAWLEDEANNRRFR